MPNRIMVTVQNGGISTETIEVTTNWAQRTGGTVTGVGLVDESTWAPGAVAYGSPASVGKGPHDENALRRRAERRIAESLSELAQSCRDAGVEYRQHEHRGATGELITTMAQRYDLVVMQKHKSRDPGLGASPRELVPSVLRDTPRPIVAVPEESCRGSGLLVAYDGSLQAARSLNGLVASGLATLGDVTVLSCDPESEEKAASMADVAADYLAPHATVSRRLAQLTSGRVGELIIAEARRQDVELIVMGAYGRAGISKFFFGSVTKYVIDQSPIPVFLFH